MFTQIKVHEKNEVLKVGVLLCPCGYYIFKC